MSYTVEIKRTGRAGWAEYREDGRGLRFGWDINTEGAEIYIPPPHEWDFFCEENGAPWAQGRRQEILGRLAQEYCRQRAKKAKWRIEDRWIIISFENYFIHRLLNKLFGP
jgi:hypothetical protein